MPPSTPTKSSSAKTEPYPSPSSDRTTPSPAKRGKGRVWTADEKLIIYEVAVKLGASTKNFEGVLEGRTGKQCYDSWNNTISPGIKKALKGDGKGGA